MKMNKMLIVASFLFVIMAGSGSSEGASSTNPGLTVVFTPASPLAIGTVYTGAIAVGVLGLAGNPLAATYAWSFTTGATSDMTRPTVRSTDPGDMNTGVAINRKVTATFSEAMNSTTITGDTFTLSQGTMPVTGTVTSAGTVISFDPTNDLATNTTYTATISPLAQDLAGNTLGAAYTWRFTTDAVKAKGPAPVDLGAAGSFVILAKTGVSSTGSSTIVKNIGLSPAAASYITGFALTADPTNTFSTSTQVTGKVYAADYSPPSPWNVNTAVSDMEIAFTDAAGASLPDFIELGGGDISGMTLAPGLYKWGSGVLISEVGVTLAGRANDVWIFQIGKDLTVANGAKVMLTGGALAKNIFWQVSGQATLGATSDFSGIILSKTLISLDTGATMNGRALAQTAVTLDAATVTAP